jgi:hypothetical protein
MIVSASCYSYAAVASAKPSVNIFQGWGHTQYASNPPNPKTLFYKEHLNTESKQGKQQLRHTKTWTQKYLRSTTERQKTMPKLKCCVYVPVTSNEEFHTASE